MLSNIPAEGAVAVVKTTRSDKDKADGQPGTKADQVRMGRQAKQNCVLILQTGMDPDDVDGKLIAPARAIPLYRSCCQMCSRRESSSTLLAL